MKLLTKSAFSNFGTKPERLVLIITGLTTLLVALQLGLIWLSLKDLPPLLPLWYSLPWGEGRLTAPTWLWILPGLSTAIMIINLLLGQFFAERILSRVLSIGALLVAAMALTTLGKIILLGLS